MVDATLSTPLPWYVWPSVLAGAALILWSIPRFARVPRVPPGPARHVLRLQELARGFRRAVVGLGLLGVGLGTLYGEDWVVTLALVFGLEELYEATMLLGGLRHAEKMHLKHA